MSSFVTRYLTAAIVVLACAWTAEQGFGFVRFHGVLARSADNFESLDGWTMTPGLASLALEAQLSGAIDSAEPDALRLREQRLVRLLTIRPGASAAWLSLAAVRNALGAPQAKIDAAFIMSGVTGPAEGVVMIERSLLGLLLWENASPDVQARTMTDLCGLTAFDPWRLRLVVATKAENVRAALRAGLDSQGCTPALIKTVGL